MSSSAKKKLWICSILIALILIIDQIVKIWVKTHLAIGESIDLIGDWCKIYFVENKGIAFGMSFGDSYGKLFLSLFRVVAAIFIFWLFLKQAKKNARFSLLVSMALIFVGAIGNIIDSCFYGIIFSESTSTQIATLFPSGDTYGTFLHGKVVDMFYFPICEWTWPSWFPLRGGEHVEFFSAIFNVADAAITIGVILLFIDQLFLQKHKSSDNKDSVEEVESAAAEKAEPEVQEETEIGENGVVEVADGE